MLNALLTFLLFAVALRGAAARRLGANEDPREAIASIANGDDALPGEFPFFALICTDRSDPGSCGCGGSLIAPNRDWDGRVGRGNDVAVLHLDSNLLTPALASLNMDTGIALSAVRAIGFGRTEAGRLSNTLQKADLDVTTDCQAPPDVFCARVDAGIATCHVRRRQASVRKHHVSVHPISNEPSETHLVAPLTSDSGGPHLSTDDTSLQVGITSYGFGKCPDDPNRRSGQVNVAFHHAYIQGEIATNPGVCTTRVIQPSSTPSSNPSSSPSVLSSSPSLAPSHGPCESPKEPSSSPSVSVAISSSQPRTQRPPKQFTN
ncbi:expressed unknown protein [Seminavis robusta]|uniref:Peptidase S1 domain-containing protein n=1 Tax=Seminavis robusta TaxID=568900 RepID=A0A9N8E5C8_9STRA|nr:expressed unknown protein [Seminavis robusta]|eukprot:Sro516_g158480.1 n/a (319) ;mRNA; f:22278-23838